MAKMKAWHVIVLDGWKTVEDKEILDITIARTTFDELKKKYAESNPEYAVKREWY